MKTVKIELNKRELADLLMIIEAECGRDDELFLKLEKAHESIDLPDYELSKTQKAFVKKAKKEGHKIRWDYSGRFMYGAKCPAVVCRSGEFGFKGCRSDNMGLDMVYYMPH